MTDPATGPSASESLSFARDIAPLFKKWQSQMQWRFDLTDYDTVKANAPKILERLTSPDDPMPPPDYPRFDKAFTDRFGRWIEAEYPR